MNKTRKTLKFLVLMLSIVLMLLLAAGVSIAVVTATSDGNGEERRMEELSRSFDEMYGAADSPMTPEAVNNLNVQKLSNGIVTLEWDRSLFASGYIIYRSEEKDNGTMSAFKKYKKTALNYFEDSDVSQARVYDYRICACRDAENRADVSDGSTVSVLTKPDSVKKVRITQKTDSAIKLNWDKNPSANGYVIYRCAETPEGFGEYKKITVVMGKYSSYIDKNLESATVYKYKVLARRVKDDLSACSTGKTAEGMTRLGAPKKLVVKKVTTKQISLAWSKVKQAEKYELYRGKKLIKTTDKTAFTNKKLKSATKYKYSVRAVMNRGGKVYKSGFRNLLTRTTVEVPGVPNGLSGTWVEVSIPDQKLYMYVDSELYLTSDVVTGNDGELSTERGVHKVISKSSPSRLTGTYNGQKWDVNVNYWLGFTWYGQGIHDSTWRSAYGGNIYQGDGSHGCVNTPLDVMSKVYAKAYIGMPVIIY